MQGWLNICKSINVINCINTIKYKNYKITSTEEGENIWKNSTSICVKKNLNKLGIEWTYCNITKPIYYKPIANIRVNGESLKTFSVRSGIRQGCQLTSLSFFKHSTEICTYNSQVRWKIKIFKVRKEEVQLCLFPDDLILYITHPKDYIPNS